MFLLDSDIVSLYFHYRRQHPILENRILRTSPELIWISTVSVAELMAGSLALIQRENKAGRGVRGHQLLHDNVTLLPFFQILPFDEADNRRYRSLPAAVRRTGRNDCRIAAQAIEHNFTVVTRNLRDFDRIPGVQTSDWTQGE